MSDDDPLAELSAAAKGRATGGAPFVPAVSHAAPLRRPPGQAAPQNTTMMMLLVGLGFLAGGALGSLVTVLVLRAGSGVPQIEPVAKSQPGEMFPNVKALLSTTKPKAAEGPSDTPPPDPP